MTLSVITGETMDRVYRDIGIIATLSLSGPESGPSAADCCSIDRHGDGRGNGNGDQQSGGNQLRPNLHRHL